VNSTGKRKYKNMRTNRITNLHFAALALLSTLNPQLSTVLAQGSLTPPGAPAPTMKTLAQIEPRTPIATAPFTISVPGSYYLTTNLTVSTGDAITIATSGVTLDLSGFTISSTAPSATGNGILLTNSLSDITILNGHIKGGVTNNGSGFYGGPGFRYGITYSDAQPGNTRVAGVSVSGCLSDGIMLGVAQPSVVESCTVWTVGGVGIMAITIKSSVAVDCGSSAVYGVQVSDSKGLSSSSGGGLSATTAQNCYGESFSSTGLYAIFTAQNCYGFSSSGTGLYAIYNAQNCYGASTSGPAGLHTDNASFCTGYRTSGRAIDAIIATGCRAAAGTNRVTYKYNMP
jgi:hypothetical protein